MRVLHPLTPRPSTRTDNTHLPDEDAPELRNLVQMCQPKDPTHAGDPVIFLVSEEHTETADRTYPDYAVLTNFGEIRMYNYFLNGEARGYGLADQYYNSFIVGEDPDEWYESLNGSAGYVVENYHSI